MNSYEQKKQARIERYKELAEKNKAKSDQVWEQANDMQSVIPFGQPILIGHHSETRDRNYRNRIDGKRRKSVELQDKADHYEAKARAAENNAAISSDDPDALIKLNEKLANIEQTRDFMKAANRIIRSKTKDEPAKIKELMAWSITEESAKALLKPDCTGCIGFPGYSFSNLGANIRRVKQRIEQLENRATQETTEIEINGVKIVNNVEDNRLQLFFPGKPDEAIRKKLKSNGFRWSRYNGCWQSYRNRNALDKAKSIIAQLN